MIIGCFFQHKFTKKIKGISISCFSMVEQAHEFKMAYSVSTAFFWNKATDTNLIWTVFEAWLDVFAIKNDLKMRFETNTKFKLL